MSPFYLQIWSIHISWLIYATSLLGATKYYILVLWNIYTRVSNSTINKGKSNIKCISMELDHHMLPGQLWCALALIQSVNCAGGMNTILPKDILSFGALMIPINVGVRCGDCKGHSLWFTSFLYSSNNSVTPHALWMGGIVILEETTPIRIEMFHHRRKVITHNDFVLI